jgi:hypothetical protein
MDGIIRRPRMGSSRSVKVKHAVKRVEWAEIVGTLLTIISLIGGSMVLGLTFWAMVFKFIS